MAEKRWKGFLVFDDPDFQITDDGTCLSLEKHLKENKLISKREMVYYNKENDIYYASHYNEDKKKYFARSLDITQKRYKDAIKTNDFEDLNKKVQNSSRKSRLAIPLELIESYSDTNPKPTGVQSNVQNGNQSGESNVNIERVLDVPISDTPDIDISEKELKEMKKQRDAELNEQLRKMDQEQLYNMLRDIAMTRDIEEKKSKKKEVEKLFENTWFTDKDIEFFWNEIAPGIIRRGPLR